MFQSLRLNGRVVEKITDALLDFRLPFARRAGDFLRV